jgi:PTS system nitrogen regulatory IIA component
MSLADLIKPDSVLCNAQARSKKHCLEILSELLVRPLPDVAAETVFAKLIERERLGCTSMTQGAAFPHCRAEGVAESHAAMIKLSEPIDFDSPDGEPVDLVFGLLVPEELSEQDYAEIGLVTNLLADEELREKLRAANSSKELHATLVNAGESLETQQLQAAEGG